MDELGCIITNNIIIKQISPIYMKFDCCNTLYFNDSIPIYFNGILKKNTNYKIIISIPNRINILCNLICTLCPYYVDVEIFDRETLDLSLSFLVNTKTSSKVANCIEAEFSPDKDICNPLIKLSGQLTNRVQKLCKDNCECKLCYETCAYVIIKKIKKIF